MKRLIEWAEKSVIDCINDVKDYMNDGLGKDIALKIVLDSTCVGTKYRNQIIEYFN